MDGAQHVVHVNHLSFFQMHQKFIAYGTYSTAWFQHTFVSGIVGSLAQHLIPTFLTGGCTFSKTHDVQVFGFSKGPKIYNAKKKSWHPMQSS